MYNAYYSFGLCGYELRASEDGETIYYRWTGTSGAAPEQHAKVRYTNKGRTYFIANGRRIHLDECLRNTV